MLPYLKLLDGISSLISFWCSIEYLHSFVTVFHAGINQRGLSSSSIWLLYVSGRLFEL